MKYFYVLMLTICISPSIKAQIDFNPNVLLFDIEESEYSFNVHLTATNTSSESQSLFWRFEEGEGFPEEWAFYIKDNNLCYPMGDYDCHPLIPNNIVAGDSIRFLFQFNATEVPGSTWGVMCLYSDSSLVNEVACTSLSISSVDDLHRKEIRLFPNPVEDRLSILNDAEVQTLEITNLNGQMVKEISHIPGQSHIMSDLQAGYYFLTLRNQNNKLVKVLNLVKT